MNELTCEILEKRFCMDPKSIKRFTRALAETEKAPEIEKKLELLESRGLLSNISLEDTEDIIHLPMFMCSYGEFEFALNVPEMLSFSDEQKKLYAERVLYWSRFTDIRAGVSPLLEKLCGSDAADEIIKKLYISAYTTVSEDRISDICSFLSAYPDPSDLLPDFIAENWYAVFSVYSDPVSAVNLLESIFEKEKVMEIFTDSVEWPRIGYLNSEPEFIQTINASLKNEVLEEAKEKFSRYLKA